jgi:hypothetical protein
MLACITASRMGEVMKKASLSSVAVGAFVTSSLQHSLPTCR